MTPLYDEPQGGCRWLNHGEPPGPKAYAALTPEQKALVDEFVADIRGVNDARRTAFRYLVARAIVACGGIVPTLTEDVDDIIHTTIEAPYNRRVSRTYAADCRGCYVEWQRWNHGR